MMNRHLSTQMFEPFKAMRVVFQVREIKANLPMGVLNCDIQADFQVKPGHPKVALKKQLVDRRMKRLEKVYAGKLNKFNEVLPPILKKAIKDK